MKFFSDELIEIYSRSNTDEVSDNEDYRELCDENVNNSIFHAERNLVESIKKHLEESIGIQTSTKNQVIEALKRLNKKIKSKEKERINICYELIIKTYSENWTKKELKHFNNYYEALKNYNDYFLSFTNRKPAKNHENIINYRYKFLIKNILGNEQFNKADKNDENLLAVSINYLLENEQLKGFFYPKKVGDNQIVEEKLKRGCKQSFVFIQIVQNIMFIHYNDTNYCHFEYEHAKSNASIKKYMKFVLAENSHDNMIKKDDISDEYDEWYDDVAGRDKIILEHTETYNQGHILKQRSKIRENLLDEINKLKWELIENVPT